MNNERTDAPKIAEAIALETFSYGTPAYWSAYGAVYTAVLRGEENTEHLRVTAFVAGRQVPVGANKSEEKNG